MLELVLDASSLGRALPEAAPSEVERARREAQRRPIVPVLGSGEADEVALCAGLKPLVRQVVAETAVTSTRARLEALGLVVREAAHRVESASTAGRVLFAGRDALRVERAVECERAPEHDLELGRLLGYPRCCVEAYLESPPPRDNPEVLARARSATRGAFRARLNTLDLAVFHYVSWIPCSFSCALSSAYADAVASHIAHGALRRGSTGGSASRCPPGCRHETFVHEIDAALGAARVVLLDDVQLSVRGVLAGATLRIDEVWPTARDRHADAALAPSALEAVARLCALAAASRTLAVHDGVLHLDERPIVRTPSAALYPFAPRAE